jgi:hypothetical protein
MSDLIVSAQEIGPTTPLHFGVPDTIITKQNFMDVPYMISCFMYPIKVKPYLKKCQPGIRLATVN